MNYLSSYSSQTRKENFRHMSRLFYVMYNLWNLDGVQYKQIALFPQDIYERCVLPNCAKIYQHECSDTLLYKLRELNHNVPN